MTQTATCETESGGSGWVRLEDADAFEEQIHAAGNTVRWGSLSTCWCVGDVGVYQPGW